jgi:hypothetical protein
MGAVAVIALAGCGGSGKKTTVSAPPTQPAPATSSSSTTTSTTSSSKSTSTTTTKTSSGSPESQQGGAGDETPISTQALFTGRAGRLSPATIRVPPFIAVTVVLHSADGRPYSITVKGKTLAVGEARDQASLKLPGLKPQGRYVVTNKGGSPPRLIVVASAEPGP